MEQKINIAANNRAKLLADLISSTPFAFEFVPVFGRRLILKEHEPIFSLKGCPYALLHPKTGRTLPPFADAHNGRNLVFSLFRISAQSKDKAAVVGQPA